MFFTDGEESLKTNIDNIFQEWLHRLLLDWHHINERCLEAFSKIFKPGKIIDPEQEPVRFKNGKIKKSSIVKSLGVNSIFVNSTGFCG